MGHDPFVRTIPTRTAHLYTHTNQAYRTQRSLFRTLRRNYRDDLMGVSSNYNGGNMFADPVASLLGFPAARMGSDSTFTITTPVFDSFNITLPSGKVFKVRVENQTDLSKNMRNHYIQSIKLDGQAQSSSISMSTLESHSEMVITLSHRPQQ